MKMEPKFKTGEIVYHTADSTKRVSMVVAKIKETSLGNQYRCSWMNQNTETKVAQKSNATFYEWEITNKVK